MNGKTDIDETLNPHSAASDKATYGFRYLNFSTHGHRYFKVTIGLFSFDAFSRSGRKNRFLRFAGRNFKGLYTPLGSLEVFWPLSWCKGKDR